MYKVNVVQKEASRSEEKDAKDVQIRWLIDDKNGAPTFAMRHFTVEPGGWTPLHKHDWEHEVFVLEGKGKVLYRETETEILPGDAVFIEPNQLHQFKNTGDKALKFLCMVPI